MITKPKSIPLTKLVIAATAVVALAVGACGGDSAGQTDRNTNNHTLQNDAATPPPFTITQVNPDHGPVTGGTEVVVRGFGFKAGAQVYFGDLLADPELTEVEGPNRIRAVTPLGSPGPVDVKVLLTDGQSVTSTGAFTYDKFYVDPASGSATGGTFVRIVGAETSFGAGATVTFGGEPLADITVVSPTLITGRTPAHTPGLVAVAVTDQGQTDSIDGAFEYFDNADPINGGLGGGAIAGEVVVTVVDVYSREPVEGAYVLMGPDASSPYQGVTDATGRVVFSAPGLQGPQMVTAAHEEYERASFVAFDARDVTVFLTPFVPPSPGAFPGQNYSMVTGLVDFGGVEFGESCEFDQMVPAPGPGERRIIKVYQSLPERDMTAVEPGDSGTIVEGDPCNGGYYFEIFTRPGSYAVYALAGIENTSTRRFTPHAMGVTRGVLSDPNQVVAANVRIDLVLSRSMTFDFSGAPALDPMMGPTGYQARVFIDLGNDGYIIRQDLVENPTDAAAPLTFTRLAPLERGLQGGFYTAYIEAHNFGSYPFSWRYLTNLAPSPNPIVVDGWLGIPTPIDPTAGGTPTTTRMIWDSTGAEATFNIIVIQTALGDPYWTLYTHGAVKQFVLPDLFGLGGGLEGHPTGGGIWHTISVKVDGLDFNDFSYRYLNDRYWSAASGNGIFFNFPHFE